MVRSFRLPFKKCLISFLLANFDGLTAGYSQPGKTAKAGSATGLGLSNEDDTLFLLSLPLSEASHERLGNQAAGLGYTIDAQEELWEALNELPWPLQNIPRAKS